MADAGNRKSIDFILSQFTRAGAGNQVLAQVNRSSWRSSETWTLEWDGEKKHTIWNISKKICKISNKMSVKFNSITNNANMVVASKSGGKTWEEMRQNCGKDDQNTLCGLHKRHMWYQILPSLELCPLQLDSQLQSFMAALSSRGFIQLSARDRKR